MDYELERMRRIEREMDSIDPEKKSRVNIYQSATSADGDGQNANVTYNHYEIHIHFPADVKPEQVRDVMALIKQPEKIEPTENITVKKSRWNW